VTEVAETIVLPFVDAFAYSAEHGAPVRGLLRVTRGGTLYWYEDTEWGRDKMLDETTRTDALYRFTMSTTRIGDK
jgi:hypothetical protein